MPKCRVFPRLHRPPEDLGFTKQSLKCNTSLAPRAFEEKELTIEHRIEWGTVQVTFAQSR